MAGLARALDLRAADRGVFLAYRQQVIDYLERFLELLQELAARPQACPAGRNPAPGERYRDAASTPDKNTLRMVATG